MAKGESLNVWIQGVFAGVLTQAENGLTFEYGEEYRHSRGPALSCSMPKAQRAHGHVAGRWFDNLLPDNDAVRDRWAAGFGERRTTAFTLLRHMGADCAGAVQVLPEGTRPDTDEGFEPISDSEIETRLAALRRDDTTWNFQGHGGRWSLGGAQGKFALAQLADGSWATPTGRSPSTHIFKVGPERLSNGAAAEYVTMRAAQIMGLPVAGTELRRFGSQTAVLSRRFDREVASDGTVRRLHQEDLCQALGLSRAMKYESDSGPSIAVIAELLAREVHPAHRSAALHEFSRALLFNWLVAGTDAHAKNYSLIHEGQRVRFAPLYDLTSSALLYPPKEVHYESKLAMKAGGHYALRKIHHRHLVRMYEAAGRRGSQLTGEMADQIEGLAPAVEQALDEAGTVISRAVREKFVAFIRDRINSARRAIPDQASAGTPAAASPPASGGVWVAPHTRNGKRIEGHWRNKPGTARG